MSKYSFNRKLPKAKWFTIIRSYYDKPYYARFRCANFVRWQIGKYCIVHRAPWLKESAIKLHPELFGGQNGN